MKYDKNGNITHLTRGGHLKEMPDWDKDDDFGTMDQLDYQYFDGSNRLRSVTDGILKNDTSGKGEFVDGNKDGDDYVYDPNGNMTQDLNKGIKGATLAEKGIEYNHLNLPTKVSIDDGGANKGTISYIYDATGIKLRKNVLIQGETTPTSTDYGGNYVYENGTLQFFSQAEGYVEPKNPDNLSQGYDYIYQYKDHLGNVRLSYKDNNGTTEILSENNYYPFGLKHKGYNFVANSTNVAQDFKYNGVELEESLGLNLYEMEFRSYDPTIGRFTSLDMVTHWSMSPYNAFDNNPAFWADPSGTNSVQDLIDEAWRVARNGSTTFTSNGDGTFSGSNGATVGDKTYNKYESNTTVGYQFNGNVGSEEKPVYEHLIKETTVQKVYELSEDFKRITVKTIKTTNYLLIKVSQASNGGADVQYASQKVVSDMVGDSYVAGDNPFNFDLGRQTTAGFVWQKGFTENQAHNNSIVWNYGAGLAEMVKNRGYDTNLFNGKTSMAELARNGSSAASFLLAWTNVAKPYKIALGAGTIIGNGYRSFGNHSGRSTQLETSSKVMYKAIED